VNQILESVRLALHSIWVNKLRSFLTVLGNIVAVTSIVTVVSLIQGMNATVSGAIVGEVGADAFRVQRVPLIRTQADEERTRSYPLITLREADAIRAFSPVIKAVVAQAERGGAVSYRSRELESVQIQGVTSEYAEFSMFTAEIGRIMSPSEVERGQFVALLGWDVADQLFGSINPLEKEILIAGTRFRVVGVSAKKGSIFGSSQDTFIIVPLAAYMRLFGARQSLSRRCSHRRSTTRRWRCASRGASSRPIATTSASSRRTRPSASTSRPPAASSPCSSGWWRCRWSSAGS
jgi:putative ABC transport system permease protein